MKKILQPQEIQVWYILPSIRKELAKNLKEKGLDQKRIARIFGITEAAVSNYFREKRARDIEFNSKIKKGIKNSAENLIKGKTITEETQKILLELLKQGTICCECKKHNQIKGVCEVCLK